MSLKSSSLLVGMRILSSQWKGKLNGDVRGPVSRQPVLQHKPPPPHRGCLQGAGWASAPPWGAR